VAIREAAACAGCGDTDQVDLACGRDVRHEAIAMDRLSIIWPAAHVDMINLVLGHNRLMVAMPWSQPYDLAVLLGATTTRQEDNILPAYGHA
jgi:hypothetical protein